MKECEDGDIPWADPDFNKWYEIRNAPKAHNGIVIAIWHQTVAEYELAFGIQNLEYPSDREDDKRTHGRNDVTMVAECLVKEITESDFSVLIEIAEIPQIISDGVLHYLGKLTWHHKDRVVPSNWYTKWPDIVCTGDVYAKVVFSDWDAGTSLAHSFNP
jgi:hypothetical protein